MKKMIKANSSGLQYVRRYKGYTIVYDKKNDEYLVYDTNMELVDKLISLEKCAEFIDNENSNYKEHWIELDKKEAMDTDGFYTDYTLYTNEDQSYFICILGDSDIYDPENSDYDFETESYDEAIEWFEDYTGFEEYDGLRSFDI